jgi:hypothetical protein
MVWYDRRSASVDLRTYAQVALTDLISAQASAVNWARSEGIQPLIANTEQITAAVAMIEIGRNRAALRHLSSRHKRKRPFARLFQAPRSMQSSRMTPRLMKRPGRHVARQSPRGCFRTGVWATPSRRRRPALALRSRTDLKAFLHTSVRQAPITLASKSRTARCGRVRCVTSPSILGPAHHSSGRGWIR